MICCSGAIWNAASTRSIRIPARFSGAWCSAGIVQTSTISYAVDGRQYVAVMTGNAQSGTATPTAIGRVRTVQGHNEIYAFALPED